MIGHRFTLGAAALFASTALMGCSQAVEAPREEAGSTSDAILNGQPADHEKYDAVGALVYYFPEDGVLDVFCSGTLVGKKSVVTARHCTRLVDLAWETGLVPAVAFGPDAFNPTAVIPITDYVAAPPGPGNENGLLRDGGRDVAVLHLESKPAGIKPAKLGEWENHMVGDRFQIAGYGYHNTDRFYGQRYAGRATARAVKGRWYELLFKGNYQAYREWYFTDSPSAARTEEEAKEWWKIYKLENNYELLAGGLRGEALGCYNDSGGPLLDFECRNELTVYGVSFAVEGSISQVCTRGGGYLVFNDKMLKFVKNNL
jgi:hypothetical protein